MTQFRKKPIVIEAITFNELIEEGHKFIEQNPTEGNYGTHENGNERAGLPWHFKYKGHPITHENDECYLIPTEEGTMNMTPSDMLITGINGEIYPCKIDIFNKTYESAEQSGLFDFSECILPADRLEKNIKCNKQLRVNLDAELQKLKGLPSSRERALSITKLQESIMWLGMDLKRLNEPNPYPDSYKPENTKIAPTSDDLKM